MINKFFKNWLEGKQQRYPILDERSREITAITFEQSEDEKIVIDFLNDIDKPFLYEDSESVKQGDYFESFLAAVFRLAGYEVTITAKQNESRTGDGGVDLILVKGQERIAVQAKHCRLNTKSPKIIKKEEIVQYSGISDEGWTNKLFITTSLFNPYVYDEIKNNEKAQKIEWYDRYGLLKLLNQLIPDTMVKQIFLKSLPEQIKKCPKCEAGFVITRWSQKNSKYFRGCTMYPNCKYVEPCHSRYFSK